MSEEESVLEEHEKVAHELRDWDKILDGEPTDGDLEFVANLPVLEKPDDEEQEG